MRCEMFSLLNIWRPQKNKSDQRCKTNMGKFWVQQQVDLTAILSVATSIHGAFESKEEQREIAGGGLIIDYLFGKGNK